MPDLQELPLEERKRIFDEWFRNYLACGHNPGGGHWWINKQYVAEVRAFYSQCLKCGLHAIHQTRGNTILLTNMWQIQSYLIFDGSFNDPYKIVAEVRRALLKKSSEETVVCAVEILKV